MSDKIVLYEKKEQCCGCGACLNICPKGAVTMREDSYGFLYPQINEDLCISCGTCKRVCAFQNGSSELAEPEVFAAAARNVDILKSASGGIFAGFARALIDEGGVAYGAALVNSNGILTPLHIGVENESELDRLQGSKYVQSRTDIAFAEVKRQLASGRRVVFCGTPCQVAGLNAYLDDKLKENLLLIDLICHGVPSARFFNDYIKLLEKRLKGNIIDFQFRDKSNGWGLNAKVYYVRKNICGGADPKVRHLLIPGSLSSYYRLFLGADSYRESCYACKYAGAGRPGDFTIGDYWGIEKEHSKLLSEHGNEFSVTKGISCLLVNTKKGERYIKKYREEFSLCGSEYEKAARWNRQLMEPSTLSPERIKIMELYRTGGYDAVEKWFCKDQGWRMVSESLKMFIPSGLKCRLKKLQGRKRL